MIESEVLWLSVKRIVDVRAVSEDDDVACSMRWFEQVYARPTIIVLTSIDIPSNQI